MYYVPIFLFPFFYLISRSNLLHKKELLVTINFIFGFFIFTIIGLRPFDVGNDTLRYQQEFLSSSYDLLAGGRGTEVAFSYILFFFKEAGADFRVFNIVYAFVVVAAIFIRFKVSPYILFIVLFFGYCFGYFFMAMTGMRQMLAVSLILLVVREPKGLKDIIFQLSFFGLAVLTHNTAIVVSPLLLYAALSSNKVSKRTKSLFAITVITLSFLLLTQINISSLLAYTKIDFYLQSDELRVLNPLPVTFWCLFALFILAVTLKNQKDERYLGRLMDSSKATQIQWVTYYFSGVALFVSFVLGLSFPLMDRFAYFFTPFLLSSFGLYCYLGYRYQYRRFILWGVYILSSVYLSFLLRSDPFGIVT